MTDGPRLRLLLVPDSVQWVTGTIARSVARFSPWAEATVVSGPVLDRLAARDPELASRFDLAHFVCPFASQRWLPRLRDHMPVVTSHHHVSEWEAVAHNFDGDAVVVGSPEWAHDLVARGKPADQVFCVPYGVDADRFTPPADADRAAVRRELGVPLDATVVGFFAKRSSNDGRYDRKGTDVFRQAARELAGRLPGLTVLIVGPGWDTLVAEFAAAGVRCVWRPYVRDTAGLARVYRALDFYWVTARVEGGPVTLLEAMSTEVTCLATPVGLAKELVADGVNGVVLPFDDPSGFAHRTAALAADPAEQRRLGQAARQTILQRMHLPVVYRLLPAVYARAFAAFADRRSGAVVPDVMGLAARYADTPPAPADAPVPLDGLPAALRPWVREREDLAWADVLSEQGQPGEALRLIGRACLARPLAGGPWRTLVRHLLPAGAAARAATVRGRLRGRGA